MSVQRAALVHPALLCVQAGRISLGSVVGTATARTVGRAMAGARVMQATLVVLAQALVQVSVRKQGYAVGMEFVLMGRWGRESAAVFKHGQAVCVMTVLSGISAPPAQLVHVVGMDCAVMGQRVMAAVCAMRGTSAPPAQHVLTAVSMSSAVMGQRVMAAVCAMRGTSAPPAQHVLTAVSMSSAVMGQRVMAAVYVRKDGKGKDVVV